MRSLLTALFVAAAVAPAQVHPGLPRGASNAHYQGNREPLLASPLVKMPPGRVQPRGWLLRQLELTAAGFSGHLAEISTFCKFEGNAWTDPKGQGQFGWEEAPYWLKGFAELGYVLDDKRIQAEAKRWLDAVMRTQMDNGYFGSRFNLDDSVSGVRMLDLWPNMVMLYPLRSWYETTGDRRILDFMTRYFRWQATLDLDKFLVASWQKWRAGDNLDSIYWLYNRTGEKWLLDLARANHERTADWVGTIPTWHGVNLSQCFREPGQYYQQTLDPRYMKATERVYATMLGLYGQYPGGMYGADENARPGFSGPRQGAETCTMVELMHSHEMLLRISGESKWADRAEQVAFNSLPASMTPDLKGLHYLTAPNLVQLDRADKRPLIDNGGDMLSYNPRKYRCCQHNVAFGWPYFTNHLWLATQGSGLAAAIYSPSAVTARVADGVEVRIEERTNYPFEETIALELSPARQVRFPLALRIPAWCGRPALAINGKPEPVPAAHGGWITIDRAWAKGDRVILELPAEIRARRWENNRHALSVERGPLSYSLRIGERWQKYVDDPRWPAYEVYATTPWNYGLSGRDFRLVKGKWPLEPQPFQPENAPLEIRARGRRIPQWKLEPNGLIGEIQHSPVRSSEPEEEITLIPMGCARLRVAMFPEIGTGAGAHVWDDAPGLPSASRASHFMPPSAFNDLRIPKNSGDASAPWFVWHDVFGTREWAQYSFSRPRKIDSVEVYWADEGARPSTGRVPHDVRLMTPTDGRVRLPASWSVTWWDGKVWRPVSAGPQQARADSFNRLSFDPVTALAVRLDVELQPRATAGILEWRLGPASSN